MAHPLSLPLFPEEPLPRQPRPPLSPPRIAPARLWMAVYFPRLMLEALGVRPTGAEAVALVHGQGRKLRVADCTAGAARLGICSGQTQQAALALAPTLRVIERDTIRERAALLKLAEAAQAFTPTVSLQPPHSLLLEVAGSAQLFGGESGIGGRAREAFAARGFAAAAALAPTPLAALWLAHALQETVVTHPDGLRSALGRLPVHALAWSPEILDACDRLGIKCLVDVFRLPRDGLARRFGADFLDALDRATGQLPDPRSMWQAPKRIRLVRELPAEFTSLPGLLPHVEGMLGEFCRELRARDAAVDRLRIQLRHWRQAPTAVTVGSALPHREASRWFALVQNHLAGLALASPVHELVLLSGRFKTFAAGTGELPGTGTQTGGSLADLVDLLRARLGRRAVFGLTATQDARPEHAWRSVEPGDATRDPRVPPPRPLELLPAPLPLACMDGRPHHRGAALVLLGGPERIEGGWWSQESWIRDYYQALSGRGE